MPLIADQTATVTCIHHDADADSDVNYVTTLTGVSWHDQLRAQPSSRGLSAACVYQMRVFAGYSTAAPAGAGVGAAEATYLDPSAWEALSAEGKAKHWTLRPGDRITCKGVTVTILAVHDNRGSRQNPHWYVEAS